MRPSRRDGQRPTLLKEFPWQWSLGRTKARLVNRLEAPDRFPRGLKPLSRAVHEAGLDFLLWFEPERVTPGTALAREHPDRVITADGDHGTYRTKTKSHFP